MSCKCDEIIVLLWYDVCAVKISCTLDHLKKVTSHGGGGGKGVRGSVIKYHMGRGFKIDQNNCDVLVVCPLSGDCS